MNLTMRTSSTTSTRVARRTGMNCCNMPIYTFNASLKRRLEDFSRKYPLLCRLERSTPEGSATYVLDKSRLSIRLVPPYSEERLAAAREYAKEHGFQVIQTEKKIA